MMVCRRPKLWLLDEPHAGLDQAGRNFIDEIVRHAVRFGATVMIACVVAYIAHILHRWLIQSERGLWTGPNTMVPRWQDFKDFAANVRWFFGGPKPKFDRWTYSK